ncbi:hypothetical protein TNCV_547801 [Trichonephila clavipes]|nr:hypothetical protein TNCV_547801 [Trichonephila clavipes]
MPLQQANEEFDFDFEDFRQYLMLKSLISTGISQDIKELETRINSDYFGIELVAQEIRDNLFVGEYEPIFETIGEMFHRSNKDCAKFIMSHCIILCNSEPTCFNFLLVTAFLYETVSHFYLKYKCFRMIYISDFCLRVLFVTKFWKIFKYREDIEKLKLFCEEFVRHYVSDSKKGALQNDVYTTYWTYFIRESFKNVEDNYSLNIVDAVIFDNLYSLDNGVKYRDWPSWGDTKKAVEDSFNNENERNSARETYRRHSWCNEAGASFNTDRSSDERQMHLNVVKCSN